MTTLLTSLDAWAARVQNPCAKKRLTCLWAPNYDEYYQGNLLLVDCSQVPVAPYGDGYADDVTARPLSNGTSGNYTYYPLSYQEPFIMRIVAGTYTTMCYPDGTTIVDPCPAGYRCR